MKGLSRLHSTVGKRLPRVTIGAFLAASALSLVSGCTKHSQPNVTYMPEMAYSPALKAQEEGSMRMPVKGTVPRNHHFYAYAKDMEGAGRELVNPVEVTRESLARGQALYNTYCMVCHGPEGLGDGSIVPKYPRPPSLQSEKIVNYKDGQIFHVITVGQNLMPSYASQIDAVDRWAVINYVRAIQKAQNPTPQDVKAADEAVAAN